MSVFKDNIGCEMKNYKFVKETPFASKLNELFLNNKNKTQVELANLVGMGVAAVNKWRNGTNRPDFDNLKIIANYFNVSIDYLLDNDVVRTNECITLIPILNEVQAGKMTEIKPGDYGDIEYYPLPMNINKECFALYVMGNSMEPQYKEGDLLIVDPTIKPTTGDCVIASTENSEKATFKKYRERYTESGKCYFELVPINPDYPIMSNLTFEIDIKGVVTQYIRQTR